MIRRDAQPPLFAEAAYNGFSAPRPPGPSAGAAVAGKILLGGAAAACALGAFFGLAARLEHAPPPSLRQVEIVVNEPPPQTLAELAAVETPPAVPIGRSRASEPAETAAALDAADLLTVAEIPPEAAVPPKTAPAAAPSGEAIAPAPGLANPPDLRLEDLAPPPVEPAAG